MFDQDYFYITDNQLATTSGTLSDKIDQDINTVSGSLQQDIDTRAPADHTHPELELATGKIISMYSTASGVGDQNSIPWNTEVIKDEIYTHTPDDELITVLSGGLYEITYYTNWLNEGVDPQVLQTFLKINPADETAEVSKSYGYSPSSTYPHLITGRTFPLSLSANDNIRIVAQPVESLAWYDDNYNYRREVTIDSGEVEDNFTDFPVYFQMTDISASNANGYDIIFVDGDDNVLPHEIQSYNQGTGVLRAWVLMDLSSSEDATLFVYYGNSGVSSSQEDKATLWADYEAVYHFEESGNTIIDATGNHNGTNNGSTLSTNGKTGNCRDFSSDYIDIGTFSVSGNQITLSAWFNADTIPGTDPRIMSKSNTALDEQGHVWMLGIDSGSDVPRCRFKTGTSDGSGTTTYAGSTTINTGTWYYMIATYNGSNVYLYYGAAGNVTQEATGGKTGNLRQNTWNTFIGANPGPERRYWDGRIDEARICTVARSQNWIQTEYNNQNSTENFYTVGPEESGALGSISLIPGESNITCRLIRYE